VRELEKNKLTISIREAFVSFFSKGFRGHGSKILSISCGRGDYEKLIFGRYENANIVSTDVVDSMVSGEDIEYFNKRGVWHFVKIKPENELPFENETFDLVFHNDTIEHTKKTHLFLKEQFRVLKKGGCIIVGTPNLLRVANIAKILVGKLNFPKKISDENLYTSSHHIQEFTEWNIAGMLEEIGFEQIERKCCFFGLNIFNIQFRKYSQKGLGKLMAHYLTFYAIKPL
jgi:ubiquinone/menaquinone biosynthesis C-methylase UbiE